MSLPKRAVFTASTSSRRKSGDEKQRRNLNQVSATHQRFADKHGMDYVVLRRTVVAQHPYWDRWLCFEQPELAEYDELLWLDNDIWIKEDARNPFDFWSGNNVGGFKEERQAGWDAEFIAKYYPRFMIELAPEERDFSVYNTGVAILPKKLGPVLREAFETWRKELVPKFAAATEASLKSYYVADADGPYISYFLQRRGLIEELPTEFNTLFWTWYEKNGKLPPRLLNVETKLAELTKPLLPHPLWKRIFAHPRAVLRESLNHCDFLHMAASKSPLWVLE